MFSDNHSYKNKIEQKKLYLDMTDVKGCTSVWVKDTEIIPAGTTVYSMLEKQKNDEYERFANEYDIHFIFDDVIPVIDFYTIPRVDIFATDSNGGYIGTVGALTDLESDAPICYIDKQKNAYLICENGKIFLRKVHAWKNELESYVGIKLYASKVEAMKENEFYVENIGHLEVERFSKRYAVRHMLKEDAEIIYAMMRENVQFYKYCDRENTLEDVYNDMEITPPGLSKEDKYYVGYFEGKELVAILDLCASFPDKETAFIGLFMMNIDYQGKGIGTTIISELFEYLKKVDFERVRLGIDKDNPQSNNFWEKQGFVPEKEVPQDGGVIIVANKKL